MTDLLDKDDKILLFSFGDSDFDPSGALILNQSAKRKDELIFWSLALICFESRKCITTFLLVDWNCPRMLMAITETC